MILKIWILRFLSSRNQTPLEFDSCILPTQDSCKFVYLRLDNFLLRIIIYKNRRGLANIPFNRYSKLYSAAGKLTTHGSQHFYKQNALKAVAFPSTAESPQLRVDTHISQNLAKQKETGNFADTSSCMCKVPEVLYFLCYLEGTVSPDFLPIFFFFYPSHLGP